MTALPNCIEYQPRAQTKLNLSKVKNTIKAYVALPLSSVTAAQSDTWHYAKKFQLGRKDHECAGIVAVVKKKVYGDTWAYNRANEWENSVSSWQLPALARYVPLPTLGLIDRCALKKESEGERKRRKKKMKSCFFFLFYGELSWLEMHAHCQVSNFRFLDVSIKLFHPHARCSLKLSFYSNYVCLGFDFFQSIQMTVTSSLASVAFQSMVSPGCPREQLHRCVKTAEPLLRNPDYVVPSTTTDVMIHCRSLFPQHNNSLNITSSYLANTRCQQSFLFNYYRIGNEFIDCVRGYTMVCLSADQRQLQIQTALDEAVKNDEMCTNLNYQAGTSFYSYFTAWSCDVSFFCF